MSEALNLGLYSGEEATLHISSATVKVNVTNVSHKDAKSGTVSVQNSRTGDTQTVRFGYIRGLGGVANGSTYLNGGANIILAQFFSSDNSGDWVQTGAAGQDGTLEINITLNDPR